MVEQLAKGLAAIQVDAMASELVDSWDSQLVSYSADHWVDCLVAWMDDK